VEPEIAWVAAAAKPMLASGNPMTRTIFFQLRDFIVRVIAE
jgi:hypothetical protein